MKKIAIILLILAGSFCTFSQTNIFKMMPALSQGYLVLNKSANPNIVRWEVIITKRSYGSNGTFSDTEARRISLSNGIYYTKLPPEYIMDNITENYLVNVSGYDKDGNAAVRSEQRVISAGTGFD